MTRPLRRLSIIVPRIAKRHPAAVGQLMRRIRTGNFDKIVLDVPISDTQHFAQGDFGLAIVQAIARRYRLGGVVGGRFVYVPRAS